MDAHARIGFTLVFALACAVTLAACDSDPVRPETPAVEPTAAALAVAPAAATLTQHGVVRLELSGATAADRVHWKSVNPAVASVDAAGTVRGLAAGTTLVRATVDGRTATAKIRVVASR